jgi:thymidylate kinase
VDKPLKIVLLGPDGAGKSSVIAGLVRRLTGDGRAARVRHLKPTLVMPQLRDNPNSIVTDPHGKPPRSAFMSLAKIVIWLGEEWYAQLFREPKQTLLICDRYYHDLLVDPVRFRFGAPLWTARLVGALMPRPALWILLDAPPEVLQSRKQEVAVEETARQCLAYRAFIRTRPQHVIVDASRPLDEVISQAERAVRSQVLREVLREAPVEIAHHG